MTTPKECTSMMVYNYHAMMRTVRTVRVQQVVRLTSRCSGIRLLLAFHCFGSCCGSVGAGCVSQQVVAYQYSGTAPLNSLCKDGLC